MTRTAGDSFRTREHNTPEIAFVVAPHLFVGYYSQHAIVVETVRMCPPGIFARLVRKAARSASKPDACHRELSGSGLDYREDHDKWYAMCLLLRHHCKPFWASSFVDSRIPAQSKDAAYD